MTIRWFSDEDRRRMREEKSVTRLWQEFLWDYDVRHAREASQEPVTPGRLRIFDGDLRLDPWSRLDRPREDG